MELRVVIELLLLVCCSSSYAVQQEDNEAEGVHWALIVAGSNGWYNYRHQADVCHAYQILRQHGIPPERIVTMMYDDIAQNEENPTKGQIINRPNGPDVYAGVVIDYKGDDVTPQNFLAALSGQAELVRGVGSGKVIKSGPKDHIFVNFADHGASGLIAFPNDVLHAGDLMKTIQTMYEKKKYGKMVLYIEACESGSMFDNLLPENISVFATTASNPTESSYACYYDDERHTYLGDVYSVNWMENSDTEDLSRETIQEQFGIVKNETNTSHVMEYGDMAISKLHVGDFQGDKTGVSSQPIVVSKVPFDAVPSEQVPLSILYRRLMSVTDHDEQQNIRRQMTDLLQTYHDIDETMKSIVSLSVHNEHKARRILSASGANRYKLTNYNCYEPAVELFDERCFDISQNDHALRQLYVLVNLCEERVPVETILEMIAKVCTQ